MIKFPMFVPLDMGTFMGVLIFAVKLMSSSSNTGTRMSRSLERASPTCRMSPFQTGAKPTMSFALPYFFSVNCRNAQFTIASASSSDTKGTKMEQANMVGKLIAENAKKAGVKTVVFDRGGFIYHGRVKALADSARKEGLKY